LLWDFNVEIGIEIDGGKIGAGKCVTEIFLPLFLPLLKKPRMDTNQHESYLEDLIGLESRWQSKRTAI